jgi:hypothetical protein
MGVLMLSFTLNFLDRQMLAAVAPTLKSEFRLTNADYGALIPSLPSTVLAVAGIAAG